MNIRQALAGVSNFPANRMARGAADETRVWRIDGTNGKEALVCGPYSAGAAVRLAELAGIKEGRATRVDVRQVWVREAKGGGKMAG
jgi:hypothetical protein